MSIEEKKDAALAAFAELLDALIGMAGSDDTPAEPEDDLGGKDRSELKEIINTEELGIAVTKALDDDAIREAIRAARSSATSEAAPEPAKKEKAKKEKAEPEDSRSLADQMKSVMKKVMSNLGREAVIKILKKYGAEAMSDVPAEKLSAAIKDAEKALTDAG